MLQTFLARWGGGVPYTRHCWVQGLKVCGGSRIHLNGENGIVRDLFGEVRGGRDGEASTTVVYMGEGPPPYPSLL